MKDAGGFDEQDLCAVLQLLREVASEPGDLKVRRQLLQLAVVKLSETAVVDPRLAPIIRREFGQWLEFDDETPAGRCSAAQPVLAPRHQRVLVRLLKGDSEKQIARALRLSPHTVHEYVKIIYRSHGVQSRGELLAQWIETKNRAASEPR